MTRQSSPAVTLAEEVLQELVWLSKDHDAEDRKRRLSGRSLKQQENLDAALQPLELLKLVLRLKQERAFSHARQILHFLRTSQVTEPELRRVPDLIAGERASNDSSSGTLLAEHANRALSWRETLTCNSSSPSYIPFAPTRTIACPPDYALNPL